MPSPYGFDVFENCLTCKWKADRFFCSLQPDTLKAFDAMTFTTVYPAGSVLYAEGEMPRGVFMLCKGRVKLSVASSEGKTLITRIAEAGEVLGMSSTISASPYKSSAETLEPSQINFIKRDDFLRLIKDHGDACYHAAEQLSQECHSSTDHIRSLGLSHSAGEKLANLILTWCTEQGKETADGMRVKLLMTHQEISQMIGTSRETVTRLFGDFREKGIISIKGSTLLVHNRAALEALVLL